MSQKGKMLLRGRVRDKMVEIHKNEGINATDASSIVYGNLAIALVNHDLDIKDVEESRVDDIYNEIQPWIEESIWRYKNMEKKGA